MCVDDRIWSFPAHGLLLSKRLQPAGSAGRQRLAHLLLLTVSRLLSLQLTISLSFILLFVQDYFLRF